MVRKKARAINAALDMIFRSESSIATDIGRLIYSENKGFSVAGMEPNSTISLGLPRQFGVTLNTPKQEKAQKDMDNRLIDRGGGDDDPIRNNDEQRTDGEYGKFWSFRLSFGRRNDFKSQKIMCSDWKDLDQSDLQAIAKITAQTGDELFAKKVDKKVSWKLLHRVVIRCLESVQKKNASKSAASAFRNSKEADLAYARARLAEFESVNTQIRE